MTDPPGWYRDPHGTSGLLRWWDGSQWSYATQPAADASAYLPTGQAPIQTPGPPPDRPASGYQAPRSVHRREGPALEVQRRHHRGGRRRQGAGKYGFLWTSVPDTFADQGDLDHTIASIKAP